MLGVYVWYMNPNANSLMGVIWDNVLMKGTARVLPSNQQQALEGTAYLLQQM